MNDKIYSFENEAGNETVIQQKKFLDAEGVKYLWSKINMQDYPNNQTLMQVIEAIDETKADINLQNIELTDEEINELKFKLKIPESLNYIYLGDTTSGYGYMCNMLNGIENYMMIPPQYEQSHPNALSEMLAGMSAAIMQTSNKLYKNILPRITLNYPKLREAGMGIFIQFYFYTYHKNKKQCGSVEAVGLYYNTKNDIYQLSRISKINSLVSYGFLKFDGNNNVLHDATERFDDTFTNDYVPASSGAIGRALNEKANKSDLFNGSWNDLNNKPFYKSELAFFKPRLPLTERFAFDMEDLFSMGAFEYPTIFNIGDTKIPGTLFVNCSEVTNQVDVHISFLSENSELGFSGNALVSWPSELSVFEFTDIQGFTLDSDEQSLEIYHKMEKIWESVIPESIARVDQIPTQIQSDWNQTDKTMPDYINNRPMSMRYVYDIGSVESLAAGEIVKINDLSTAAGGVYEAFKISHMQPEGSNETMVSECNIKIGNNMIAKPPSVLYFETALDNNNYTMRDFNRFRVYVIMNVNTLTEDYKDLFPSKGVYLEDVGLLTGKYDNITLRMRVYNQLDPRYISSKIARVSEIPQVDNTLSIEGAAADAKAVGDAFATIPKQIQSDWNQNDESAVDYIKNRPFYVEDPVKTVVFEEETVVVGPDLCVQCVQPMYVDVGRTYYVTFNGVEYECVAWKDKDYYNISCIGNGAFVGVENQGNGEPFLIEGNMTAGPNGCFLESEQGEHTISISTMIETVHQLDIKYVPSDDKKMNVESPVCVGEFSMNRSSHKAIGNYSSTLGISCAATGDYSHAEGCATIAAGQSSHAQGKYNIEDSENKYAHIVGNGYQQRGQYIKSNAHTLDWDGNAWFSGDVYVDSTSGTNRDEGSVKLARISDIPEELTEDEVLQILIECEVIDPVTDENSNILLEQNNTILIY